MVFDADKISDAQFWHDMHYKGSCVSDPAKERIDAAEITGVHFNHREQA